MATYEPEEATHEGNYFSRCDTQAFTKHNFAKWLHRRKWEESVLQKSDKGWKMKGRNLEVPWKTYISDSEEVKFAFKTAQKTHCWILPEDEKMQDRKTRL